MRKISFFAAIVLLPLQMMSQNITPAIEKYVEQYFKDIGEMDIKTLKKYVPEDNIMQHIKKDNFNMMLEDIVPNKLQQGMNNELQNLLNISYLFQILNLYFENAEMKSSWDQLEIMGFYEYLINVENVFEDKNTIEAFAVFVLVKDKQSNQYYSAEITQLFNKNGNIQGGIINIKTYENKNLKKPLEAWKKFIKETLEERTLYPDFATEATVVDNASEDATVDTTGAKVGEASYVSSYSDLKTIRYVGTINNIVYVFDISYANTEELGPFYYLDNISIEKDGIQNSKYNTIEIISQLSPVYIFKETDFNNVYFLKLKNEKQIEIAQMNEQGESSGFITFQQL